MKFKLSAIAATLLFSHNAFADSMENIERITIKGQVLSSNQSNSIKTPTPILDVPQSLSIFTDEEIVARGITSIGEIIDYTPGVNTSQGEGHRDAIVFRGVRSTADFYMDGNRDDVQYYRSLYNVEQVEILRGPNALLFGRGGTGGVLNRVSKKAQLDEQFTGYTAALNTFGGYMGTVDTNFVAGDDSAIRINAMIEELDNHRDFYDGTRYGFNPTARIELNDKAILDLSYEYANHERFIDRGIPTGSDGRPVEAFEDIVFGDPDNNYNDLEAHLLRANLEYQFNDSVKGNFNAFYGDYEKIYANFYASGYDQAATPDQVTLDGYIDNTYRDNLILSGNLIGEFETGDIGHTIIFGTEYIQTNSDQNRLNPVFSTSGSDKETFLISRPLNFRNFDGVNAAGIATNGAFSIDSLNDDTRVDLKAFSVYIQDEIELSEHLDIVIGARFDRFEIDVHNVKDDEFRDRTDEEVSPRAGIIYKPQENISIYASYSESFLPRSGEQFANINGDNDALEPNTYSNQEVGIKWDFAESLSFTAAIFENEESSPQVADGDPETLDIVDQQIDGFELQIKGMLTDDWSINANYSYLDGEIVDRNGPTGRTPRELPENTFSVWTSYQVSDVFGFGVGATYQDESFIGTGNGEVLPSYTRFDASAFYDVSDDLRVQLHIENLFDELYFPNAHSTHQATVGAPLNAMVSIVGSL